MKKITLLIALLFAFYANSQTALTAGDIAFVGSNADGSSNAEDNVSFVLLKDIDAATTIIFTDMGWNDTTGFFTAAGDGSFTWTSGVARTAGEVVTIDMGPLAPAAYSVIGDQMFAIQGTLASPIFIAGLQFNDTSGYVSDAVGKTCIAQSYRVDTTDQLSADRQAGRSTHLHHLRVMQAFLRQYLP